MSPLSNYLFRCRPKQCPSCGVRGRAHFRCMAEIKERMEACPAYQCTACDYIFLPRLGNGAFITGMLAGLAIVIQPGWTVIHAAVTKSLGAGRLMINAGWLTFGIWFGLDIILVVWNARFRRAAPQPPQV